MSIILVSIAFICLAISQVITCSLVALLLIRNRRVAEALHETIEILKEVL